ncbi:hypothetical protein [Synechococcus phage S-N03]|uniref:Uncharacterized protein n=1 Tax=Synechococcus phage S-N03 TaxID=2718943 RepID=A0A6G8R5Z3_9CAUD|nr:hypothetical protein PQC09_gp158 [Synechococcus phage S-N03]QIN96793.1 hypothetical protein [Synechococcus phage S-N03]
MDRVRALLPTAAGKSPTSNMKDLLEILTPSVIIPEVDKYYVFVYRAKTKGITYDQHPFVVVTGIFKWGFTGYNLHLGQPRRYTWAEALTNLYEVSDEELNSVEKLPITLIKQS